MRKIKDVVYSLIRFTQDNFRLFIDFLSYNRHRVTPGKNCHYLIVKDSRYLKLAKYSLSSMLRYNPDWNAVIHTDKVLFGKSNLLRILFGQRVEILFDQVEEADPLSSKCTLILQMQGKDDVFVDIDTRWNARCPKLDSITVLVKEFRVIADSFWYKVAEELQIESKSLHMLNTSFFSWSKSSLGVSVKEYENWKVEWDLLSWQALCDTEAEVDGRKRLHEQFFLSCLLSDQSVKAIKETDLIADGGVLESSYFGATGHRFAR